MPEPTAAQSSSAPTSTVDYDDLRRLAVELAEAAAAHVRARRPEVFTDGEAVDGAVATKGHATDPVTIVDTESEQLIRGLLATRRPADAILGEEGGGDVGATAPGTVTWVLDPIDGTVNFLYGLPGYAVSVAAVRDGEPVAGAVVDVAAATTYSAALGGGSHAVTADGTRTRLRCTREDSLSLALVATGFAYGRDRRTQQAAVLTRVLPEIRDIRRLGAAAMDLCHVAAGRLDAYYEHGLNAWDWAAGALIAAEAGAVVRVPPVTVGGAAGELTVVAAPGIATDLTALLERAGATTALPD
ncbi:inositol monophosphatase family protein [Nocardia mangyaensis]|uniref:inositol monophosphatase family protein n=1 Tax=Nocardia mangyaensis TaxID=2213200 RepID=UPI002677322C|nr:inositol monophosphatase family protein [Nocardia mangyaensis]MDO3649002.1 inositol monophosphatase family protein [Nocardia mangyaensis]